jgi:hypothetical protein
MNKLLLAAVMAFGMSSVAMADTTGALDAFVVQEGNNTAVYNLSGETILSFGITDNVEGLVGGKLLFTAATASTVQMSEWYVGARFANTYYVTLGKQDDLWIDDLGREISSGLANPVSGEFSVIAGTDGDVVAGAVFVGYNATTEQVTNTQVALQFGTPIAVFNTVTAVADYNNTTTDYAFGVTTEGQVFTVDALTAITYANNTFAYELGARYNGVLGFIGGNENDVARYVGAGYEFAVGDADLWLEGSYDLRTDEPKFGTGVSFSF